MPQLVVAVVNFVLSFKFEIFKQMNQKRRKGEREVMYHLHRYLRKKNQYCIYPNDGRNVFNCLSSLFIFFHLNRHLRISYGAFAFCASNTLLYLTYSNPQN